MKKVLALAVLVIITFPFLFGLKEKASADSLSDNVEEQLNNLDFSEIDKLFLELDKEGVSFNKSFIESVKEVLKGQANFDYATVFNVFFNNVTEKFKAALPTFISVIAISILYGIICTSRSSYLSESTKNIVYLACYSAVCLLVLNKIFSLVSNTVIIIKRLSKLIQIMSPIMLTLMSSVGANVSVSIYTPAIVFISEGIISIITAIVLPILSLIIIFNVVSNLSDNVKLNKFSDFFSGLLKWIFGITGTVFTFFISAKGITAGISDGISVRAAKYAISNSIPIIGGLFKDGFDLVLAGSVLIKNAIGLVSIITIFYLILTPLLDVLVVQLLLKLTGAITEPVGDKKLSDFCVSLSKSLNYVTASYLLIGFIIFITIILLICTGNTYV